MDMLGCLRWLDDTRFDNNLNNTPHTVTQSADPEWSVSPEPQTLHNSVQCMTHQYLQITARCHLQVPVCCPQNSWSEEEIRQVNIYIIIDIITEATANNILKSNWMLNGWSLTVSWPAGEILCLMSKRELTPRVESYMYVVESLK